MHPEEPAVAGVAERLSQVFGQAPRVAVVLGSGLGPVADRVEGAQDAPFDALGLPQSTVPGHAGVVRVGTLAGRGVAVLRGRIHLYEGHPPATVVRGVRALHRWGVRRLVLTCSVGGIRDGFDPGTLVLVTDHLNFQRANPLTGPAFGTRFPDLAGAYDARMRAVLAAAGARRGTVLHEGVLAAMAGPAYETPAEIRMLHRLGADLVGMSTVPEVLAAAEIGLPTAVIAVVSNRAAGLTDQALTHEEVTDAAEMVADRLADLFEDAIGDL